MSETLPASLPASRRAEKRGGALLPRLLVAAGLCLALAACATTPFPRLHVYPLPKRVTFAGEPVPVDRTGVAMRISYWYNYYLARPWIVAGWLSRARQVFPLIDSTLKEEGLPQDLRYIAVAESYLVPRAYSGAGAAGIWQFIAPTAAGYGLVMNTFIDERYDYRSATYAAADYLRRAKAEIGGPWLLAVAAYNLGVFGVVQRVERQQTTDFWDMVFPYQTDNYVPRIIAIKLVMEHAARLGIKPEFRLPRLRSFTIGVYTRPVFLTDIARYLGLTFREVWEDNPQIWKPYLPPGRYRLYLPQAVAQRAAGLDRFLNSLPYEQAYYVARGGETVAGAAASLGLTSDELATFNNLHKHQVLQHGQRLLYWKLGPPSSSRQPAGSAAATAAVSSPVVRAAKAPGPHASVRS